MVLTGVRDEPRSAGAVLTGSASPARLHHFFEAGCDQDPRRIAVSCGPEQVTYGELDARANRLAHFLRGEGIRAQSRVGILLERSVQTYVALLGMLKSGATFVPLDPSLPPGRVAFIAQDSSLCAIVTNDAMATRLSPDPCRLLRLDYLSETLAACPASRLRDDPHAGTGDDLAYIMYTSGTTGRPKGVAVTPRNICNFVAVASRVYGLAASDRVYQGMALSFDFSIEEIWPAFLAGACLVPGPSGSARFGPELARFLAEQRVTALFCVPTLLATLDQDVPSLRFLAVGGEACPPDLVNRWSRPGRRMLNTYGPTETTVTATWGALLPDRPVTIGRPMPTYTVHVLDEQLKPVQTGGIGEIHIGGPGVALGYLNRPDLTAQKFIPDPFAAGGRLYKTGDLGRFTADGELEFLGRNDSQVKIRGYRIELAEIESVLLEAPAVEQAVVAPWPPRGEIQDLAAYLKPRRAVEPQLLAALHEKLRERLPAYMVPAYLEVLDEIPVLANGKVDRSRLPAPRGERQTTSPGAQVPPEGELEQAIAAAWSAVFRQERLSVEDNFFLDLGGHSLLAARAASALRRDPRMRDLAIGDLYAYPTVRSLAAYVAKLAPAAGAAAAPSASEPALASAPDSIGTPRTARPVAWCGFAQAMAIYAIVALFAAPALVFLSPWTRPDGPWELAQSAAGLFIGCLLALQAAGLILPVVLKWLILGRARPGSYPLWGVYFFRWWLARKLQGFAPLGALAGSPLLPVYLRLLGARIGRGCHLGTPYLTDPDLVEIGPGASVGYGTQVCGYKVEDGKLHLGPVRLGAGCYVGCNAVLLPGASMEDAARLGDQSLLVGGQTVPAGQSWSGSPARPDPRPDPAVDALVAGAKPPASLPRRALLAIAYALAVVTLPLIPALSVLPAGLVMMEAEQAWGGWWFLLLAPVGALLFVLCFCGAVVVLKRLLLPTVTPGVFRIHGLFYLRKWLTDKLADLSLGMVQSLYATLYLVPWLRLLGASVGRRAEISTAAHVTPNLLSIGDESFVADAACIGPARVYRGAVLLDATRLGRRSFLGNSAFMPGQCTLPDGCLVGVLSVPPPAAEPGTAWLGSPAILLPRRQPSQNFPEHLTFAPTPGLYAQRLFVEYFRVTLPATLALLTAGVVAVLCNDTLKTGGLLAAILEFPVLYFTGALAATLLIVGLKELLVGAYRPRVRPLWSHFVWRTELITGVYENVTVPMLMGLLTGTPFAPCVLRVFGARFGKRVYLETTYLTEFDLVSVGDEAAVCAMASLQTHLFEDRVMKMSHVQVGPRCSVGRRAVVLYDSVMEEGASLEALSLLMKGESLPAGTRWRGAPARRCG